MYSLRAICLNHRQSPAVASGARQYLLAAATLPFLLTGAHAQSSDAVTLQTIEVNTKSNDNQIDGYVARRTTAATKTSAPWIETPQSVSTIGAEQIRDQKPMKFDEIFRYAPGVKGETFGTDPRNDWFLIRGFKSDNEATFLDGLQLFYTSYASYKLYPFALDRLDIARGPSSSLYGGGSPGGVINATSKMPPTEPLRYMEVGVNNFGNRYFQFDLGGPVPMPAEYGKAYYRLTGMARAGDTQVDYTRDDAYFINPALTWEPNMDTKVTLLASASRSVASGINFLPYVGTVTPAPFGRISTSTFLSEPNMDRFRREQEMIGYQLEHTFSDALTFRQNARYSHVDIDFATLYGGGYVTTPAAADVSRSNFHATPTADQFSLDNQLEYKFGTGPLQHTALLGVDLKHYAIDDVGAFSAATPINVVNPVYTPTLPTTAAPYQNAYLTQKQAGVYVQDQIKLDRWTLVLSGREDFVSTNNDNRIGASQDRSDSKFTGRAGIIYTSAIGLAPYASYSTSFNPVIGTNGTTNELLTPETGKQTEFGIKYQPEGFNGHFTATWFDLVRQNVLTTIPVAPFLQTQTGEIRSRGIELEAVLNPAPGLQITGAYTQYDFETTKDANPANVGKILPGVPEKFASLWADYTFQDGPLRGFGFGGGVRYVGSSYADTANTLPVDAYTLLDATVHYEVNGWRAAINVVNLTDKTYVASCSSAAACYYGDRLRTTASLSYKW